MDRLVIGMQNILIRFDENCPQDLTNMASDLVFAEQQQEAYTEQEQQQQTDDVMNSSAETAILEDDAERSGEDEFEEYTPTEVKRKGIQRKSCGGSSFGQTRQLPSRSSKDAFYSLSGIKRRTIMKPTKRTPKYKDFNLKPSQIKKLYLNKKITNFKPSGLETIFEEPSSSSSTNAAHNDSLDEVCSVVGGRKLKRTLLCSNGQKYNVALIKKRRAKIKNTFGKRFALKKISLEEFLEKLNNSMEKEETNPSSCGGNVMESETMAATGETTNNSTSLFNALTLAAIAAPHTEKAALLGNGQLLI